MQVLVYDGSFAGLLTAIFDVYEYRYNNASIMTGKQRQDSMFATTHIVYTEEAKAGRVWQGLKDRVSATAISALNKTFLSEELGLENKILEYAKYAFANTKSIEQDYAHPAVRYVTDTAKKVHREKHRMEAFVRFQRTQDTLYFATIEPDFNVVPLIVDHFCKRYADQLWMIYDVKRKYGIYYDLKEVQYVNISFNDTEGKATDIATILDDTEILYQQLWQKYFTSVNIPARKNMKLHIQHMPYRYWKYLVEKQPAIR